MLSFAGDAPTWPHGFLISSGGATPGLPDHILPKEETIRAVEEIVAHNLSLRATPRYEF